MKTKYAIAVSLFALAYAPFALAQPPGGPPPWDWPEHWHMWGGGWGFWWIFPMLMFLLFFVCFVVFFFVGRGMFGGHRHGGAWHMTDRSWGDPTFSALQLLNERYARGDIQKAEYEEKKAAILAGGPR